MARSKTSPEAIDYAEKLAKAIELRKARLTYEEIADTLQWGGKNPAKAIHKAVTQALKRRISEATDELRALHAETVREMIAVLYPSVLKGSQGASGRVLSLLKREARMFGIDAPLKVAQTDAAGKDKPANVVFYIPDNGRDSTDSK